MNQEWFRQILLNRKSSLGIRLLFGFLCFLSFFYRMGIYIRNMLYKFGIKKTYKAGKPVISIGNITAGGTGKTPLVIWLCNYLADRKKKCAILTRGYKAGKAQLSDEPAMLAKACPLSNVVINSDRVKGAEKAVSELGSDVLIMDDGFQHIRLNRDINIIAVDATCPFGFERLLPAGFLREPLNALIRADAAVITRADLVCADRIFEIEKKIQSFNKNIAIAKAIHKPMKAIFVKGQEIDIESLKTKKVYAFCGIGNPEAFFKTFDICKISLVGSKIYNDHHKFIEQDLTDVYEEARYLQADVILSTQKDWVKTALFYGDSYDISFGYLAVEISFIDGQNKIEQIVSKIL